VSATKLGNVCLEAGLVEPAEHLVELFAQHEPNEQHWQLAKPHRFAQNAAENLGGFGIGQRAAGDLQLQADELARSLKGQGRKSADVVSGNRLIGLVSPDRIEQLAFENADFDLVDVVVLHKG